ncbi:hypothetical protein TRIUR3_31279 [Triticum urartu]|uniref:Uncharacterized protein n=1 Tax=Triticum urartu TaxID=4572 RepID=M7YVN8_TRIUA|nr:hypothetical protein TRIUR3_31279 [Triticum urartu]
MPNSGSAEDQRASQKKLAAAATSYQQGAQSVPDSSMLDKNSSFGSTSLVPSLSNLPPIQVKVASWKKLQLSIAYWHQAKRPVEGRKIHAGVPNLI